VISSRRWRNEDKKIKERKWTKILIFKMHEEKGKRIPFKRRVIYLKRFEPRT
jgi:hypothetical protein